MTIATAKQNQSLILKVAQNVFQRFDQPCSFSPGELNLLQSKRKVIQKTILIYWKNKYDPSNNFFQN